MPDNGQRGLVIVPTYNERDNLPRLIPLILRKGEQTTADRFGFGDGACGAAIEPGVAGRTAYSVAANVRHCREVAPTPEGLAKITGCDGTSSRPVESKPLSKNSLAWAW